jgi:hypothetical protein
MTLVEGLKIFIKFEFDCTAQTTTIYFFTHISLPISFDVRFDLAKHSQADGLYKKSLAR